MSVASRLGLTRVFEWFRGVRSGEVPISNDVAASIPVFWGAGIPRAPQFDVRKLIDEGYRKNVVIFTCIQEIAQSVAEPELIARNKKTKEPLPEEHPLQALLQFPHPDDSKFSFFEKALIHLHTAGSCYIHKDRNVLGQVVRLTLMRPDRVAPVPGADGRVEWYEYRVADTSPVTLPATDVISVQLPDPLDDYNGLSPIMVAAKFADMDSEAAEYMRAFFMNGGVPAGILKLKTPARAEERLRIQQAWQERYGRGASGGNGSTGWHTLGIINADADYQDIGTTPDKLRLDGVWGITESRLCAAFGVPPQVVQMKIGMQFSTYENYHAAVRTFWMETLVPMYGRFNEKLTAGLAMEFEDDIEIVFDTEHIPALQDAEDALHQRALAAFAGGVITRDEAREMIGLEPLGENYVQVLPTMRKCDEDGIAEEPPAPELPPGMGGDPNAPPGLPGAPKPPMLPGGKVPPQLPFGKAAAGKGEEKFPKTEKQAGVTIVLPDNLTWYR